MNPQYEIASVGDFAFQREAGPKRGTQYRCTICNESSKRLRVKGVLDDLSGPERTRFRKLVNAMHNRHKKTCAPGVGAGNEGGGGGEGSGGQADNGAREASAGSGESGNAGGDGGDGGGDGAQEGDELPPPLPPLDSRAIATWTASHVIDNLLYLKSVPATFETMRHLHSDHGPMFVRCVLRNEIGIRKTLVLPDVALRRLEHLRQQFQASRALYQSERTAERNALQGMFETVFKEKPQELRDVLTKLTEGTS